MAVTPKSDLAARAAAVIPGGVNSGQRRVPGLEELVIALTSGATFTDGEGNTYTDYHAAFGPPLLGHNDPDVDAAVAATATSVGLMGVGVTQVEIELAERLTELVPSVEKVLLTETGSEATFHAIRVARAATGRRHIVKFQGCYHGWHDSVAMNVISLRENVGRRDPVHEHVFRLGERTRRGLAELYRRLGVPTVVSGFGSVFVTYFLEGEVESYDDLLTNDVELFTGYRRELMKHGIFELPLNLKRSHFSYAHSDDDVDRLLEATEVAVTTVLAAR